MSALFFSMQKYPIETRKIVFSTFEGDGGYCCNPRYIANEMIKRMQAGARYDLVWLVHDTSKQFPKEIRVVQDTPENTAYELSTAKVWVDNYRKPYGTLKRPGQLYIQTWHATIGFKAVGLYRGDKFPRIARIVSEYDSAMIDCLLSNSEYCKRVYPKKLLYSKPLLQVGSPRVDILVNDRTEVRRNIRKRYGLPQDCRIIMYAPTFRGGNQRGRKQVFSEMPTIDFVTLRNSLRERFGSEWFIFLRLHPQVAAKLKSMPVKEDNEYMTDVSQADDISELLAASDALVTDYSSCAFDALYAHIPVFIYADDIREYTENRGDFMWKREDLPFLIAENNVDLINNIMYFNEKDYCAVADRFMISFGIHENGNASELVTDIIENYMKT